jgi:phage terminase Nu1 subunit (DNA packaging protein)
MNPEVLNSWKEIASYLGRGVRTVQRWEQELGLPVRRPRGKERSAVIALKPDLDAWLHNTPQHALRAEGHRDPESQTELHTHRELLERTHLLLEQSVRVKEAVSSTLAITAKLRQQQAEWRRERSDRTRRITILMQKAKELTCEIYAGGEELTKPASPARK